MDQNLQPNDTSRVSQSEPNAGRLAPYFESWWVRLGLFIGVAGLAFAPLLRGQFIWDDLLLVDRNPLVTGKLNLFTIWFRTDFPLSLVALWIQWLAWGANPLGYHVVNLLLHAGSALLLWGVLNQLKVPGAPLAALLFLVHPVCVGTVGWISELKNTFSTLLFFISLWCYLRTVGLIPGVEYKATTRELWSNRSYWLSLGIFFLALLAKTSTVMLPVVLLLGAWYQDFGGRLNPKGLRLQRLRSIVVSTLPFFLLALVFGLMTVWFQTHQAMGNKAVQVLSLTERAASVFRALLFYLDKAIWPGNLSMIYPGWSGMAWNALLRAAIFLIGIAAICRLWPAFRRTAGLGLAFFVLNLLPILGLVDMYFFALSPVSDHLQYLALSGTCAVVGSAFAFIFRARPFRSLVWLPASGFLALVTMFGFLSHGRSTVLARDESVWRDTLAKNPSAWLAHNNLGCILAERQDFAGAEQHFTNALKINPRDAQANCNFGRLLALRGDLRGAEQHYRAALEENSRDAEILKSFASTLLQQGRAVEALPYLRRAAEAEPSPKNRLELANALQMSGATKEAVQEFKLVLAREPDSLQALNNLAWLLATSRDGSIRNGREAVPHAEHACKLTRHEDPMALGTLASAYAECARFDDAVSTMAEAIAVAERQSKPGIAAMGRQLQTLFKSGKPYRQ